MTREEKKTDFEEMSGNAQALLEETAEETSEKVVALREQLNRVLQVAKNTYGQIEEKTVAGARAADQSIRNNPYTSIGIAAGGAFSLGLLVGLLARGRR